MRKIVKKDRARLMICGYERNKFDIGHHKNHRFNSKKSQSLMEIT